MPHFNLQEEILAISNPIDLPLYSFSNELDLESLDAKEVDQALESMSVRKRTMCMIRSPYALSSVRCGRIGGTEL
jgi:hypothetical protein